MVDLPRRINISKYQHFTRKINNTFSHLVCPSYFLAISAVLACFTITVIFVIWNHLLLSIRKISSKILYPRAVYKYCFVQYHPDLIPVIVSVLGVFTCVSMYFLLKCLRGKVFACAFLFRFEKSINMIQSQLKIIKNIFCGVP